MNNRRTYSETVRDSGRRVGVFRYATDIIRQRTYVDLQCSAPGAETDAETACNNRNADIVERPGRKDVTSPRRGPVRRSGAKTGSN